MTSGDIRPIFFTHDIFSKELHIRNQHEILSIHSPLGICRGPKKIILSIIGHIFL